MGTWGSGIFDNDCACDWLLAFESRGIPFVRATLKKALSLGPECAGSYIANDALAACEVIARAQGNIGDRNYYTDVVDELIKKYKLNVSPALAKMAVAVIEAILADPDESIKYWVRCADYLKWKANVEDLKSRIRV